jgi:hypothetical protein
LARSNSLISNLSQVLGESHTYKNQTLKPVEHEVAWDENLAIASAAIVGRGRRGLRPLLCSGGAARRVAARR